MAYAETKIKALSEIISTEMQSLGQDIRAVIVTDFEKTSATALVEGVMDDEAGGAIAAFRSLVQCDSADILDPILMTGSTVLVNRKSLMKEQVAGYVLNTLLGLALLFSIIISYNGAVALLAQVSD